MIKNIENLILLAIFGSISLFFVAGCENDAAKLNIFEPKEVVTEDPTDANERARLTKENKILKRDIEKLKADNEILTSRVNELTDRQRKLTQKLTEVQLDNRQMKKAVEVYTELPAERDRYKLKYESAMQTVVKLKTELDKCQAAKKTPAKPAAKPTSKPAVKKSTKPVSPAPTTIKLPAPHNRADGPKQEFYAKKRSSMPAASKPTAKPKRPKTLPTTQPVVDSLPAKLPVTMPTPVPATLPASKPAP